MDHRVVIEGDGRSGTVRYEEASGSLHFYWEYGGGDVIAMVQTGDAQRWEQHPWAVVRRAEILRIVADEVVRQKPPNCRAEINELTGDILLRQIGPPPAPAVRGDVAFVRRYSKAKLILGLVVLVLAVIFAAVIWLKDHALGIDPGKGAPLGLSLRTEKHIATVIETLVPYVPSLNRDHSKDQYRLSVLLVPLDGSATQLIDLPGKGTGSAFSLAEVLGSDGRTLWVEAGDLHGIDLSSYELLSAQAVRQVDRSALPKPFGGAPLPPKPEDYFAAGLFTDPDVWLGLHSELEIDRDFKAKSWVKRIVHADNAKQQRRFHLGALEMGPDDDHHRILHILPTDSATYLNAALLRMDASSEPMRMRDPRSVLMVYTSDPGLKSTLVMARADQKGKLLWKTDTGIDRFTLRQVLPGESSTAFVGSRPSTPGKVSEPLLVIVEHATGKAVTHSLWR